MDAVAAALIGAAVALLGAALVNRREDRFRFNAEKRELYATFTRSLRDAFAAIETMPSGDDDDLERARNRAFTAELRVEELRVEIEMVAPAAVVDAATKCQVGAFRLWSARLRHLNALRDDRSDISPAWSAFTALKDEFFPSLETFRRLARADLGVDNTSSLRKLQSQIGWRGSPKS